MALKSESASQPNGVVNVTDKESGTEGDLEDGEIFDDEDEPEVDPQNTGENKEKTTEANKDKRKEPIVTLGLKPEKKLSPDRRAERDRKIRTRRKRLREEEESEPLRFPQKPIKHRRSRELDRRDEEVDENEMMGMRGGNSPLHKPFNHHHENHWDRYDSMDEDDDGMMRDRRRLREGFGGPGRLARRARLSRGGMKRRGTGRGGKPDREFSICKFYMQGKCQKGPDCPFSHNALPPRKLELCKFYMMDCCAKKDKCLYMHNEFPCKYYHMGLKCFSGKRCKFSHNKMSPQLKTALMKHLETAPKDMLGDFPRGHNRDQNSEGRGGSYNHDLGRREPERMGGCDGPRPRPHRDPFDRKERIPFDGRLNSPIERRGSDEDESRTPMPSPPQENLSDRDRRSLERELRVSPKEREHRDSGSGEDVSESIPPHLPRKQRELYLRIQQQQRKVDAVQAAEERDNKEEELGEENWYSSDEEGSSSIALNTILRGLVQPGVKSTEREAKAPPTLPVVPPVLPDIDVTAVSKLLSSVRETIQQKTEGVSERYPQAPAEEKTQRLPPPPPPEEKRSSRDPRLRNTEATGVASEGLIIKDMDLRLAAAGDVDLRHLPFKPAPLHQAATEIDASFTTHPLIEYKLVPFNVPKPDYSTIKPFPKNIIDPRLRRFHTPSQDFVARDPRNREIKVPLAADPRRKSVLLNQPVNQGTPRYEEPTINASSARDCDLRFPPPSPNIDEPRALGPPVGVFLPAFPQRHADIDLRVHTHSHFNYK